LTHNEITIWLITHTLQYMLQGLQNQLLNRKIERVQYSPACWKKIPHLLPKQKIYQLIIERQQLIQWDKIFLCLKWALNYDSIMEWVVIEQWVFPLIEIITHDLDYQLNTPNKKHVVELTSEYIWTKNYKDWWMLDGAPERFLQKIWKNMINRKGDWITRKIVMRSWVLIIKNRFWWLDLSSNKTITRTQLDFLQRICFSYWVISLWNMQKMADEWLINKDVYHANKDSFDLLYSAIAKKIWKLITLKDKEKDDTLHQCFDLIWHVLNRDKQQILIAQFITSKPYESCELIKMIYRKNYNKRVEIIWLTNIPDNIKYILINKPNRFISILLLIWKTNNEIKIILKNKFKLNP